MNSSTKPNLSIETERELAEYCAKGDYDFSASRGFGHAIMTQKLGISADEITRYKFWRDANPNEAAQVLSHPVLNSPAGCVFNYPHGNSVPGSPIYPRSFPSTPPGHGSPLLRSSPSSYENMRLGYPYGDSLEIQHLRKMIEERDQVIAERNKMITERDAVIEERNKMLKEKEDKLRSFRESIAGVLGNYM